ncbi:CotH kinase family protein [Algoriphagus sp.]|uniref:CotH kinase family protein n=1 Tax=Algoriphagus sp. TaxID=1872435 RepID=UPI003F6FE31E
MRKILLFSAIFLFLCDLRARAQDIRINEIMSSNSGSVFDEDGDDSDWIELSNIGESPVDLEGFLITDDESNPGKWEFPAITLPGKSTMLVWASGKDRRIASSPLHTNFSIKASGGETLLLYSSEQKELDRLEIPAIPTNNSYGRFPNGTGAWYFMESPTPGKDNKEAGQVELLVAPAFSQSPGWYEEQISLELSSPDESVKILYTLDGSVPNIENVQENGSEFLVNYYHFGEWETSENIARKNKTYVYTGPLEIADRSEEDNDLSDIITTYKNEYGLGWKRPKERVFKGNVVRAAAYKDGKMSAVTTGSYLIDRRLNQRYALPVISLTGSAEDLFGYERGIYVQGKPFFDHGGTPGNYVNQGNFYYSGEIWERPVHVEFYLENGERVISQNFGTRIHGGGSVERAAKGLRLYGRDIYDTKDEISYPIFPNALDAFGKIKDSYKRVILRAGGDYMDIYTDAVNHQIMEPAKVDLQHSLPAVLLLNGEYWGLINIRDRYDDHHIARQYNLDQDNVIILDAPWGEGSVEHVDEGRPEDINLYREVYQFAVNNDLQDDQNFSFLEEKIDMLSYIDYQIMFIYLNNVDWYGDKHFRYWRAREIGDAPFQDGKWRFMIWDFDTGARIGIVPVSFDFLNNFIHPEGGGEFYSAGDPSKTAMLRSLLTNEKFKNLFINRFADHMNSTFRSNRVHTILRERFSLLESSLGEHYDRWNHQGATLERRDEMIDFFSERPDIQREHIQNHFNLEGNVELTLSVYNDNQGFIKCNTLDISQGTPGVNDLAYPWKGIYFKNVPVTLEAKAKEGFTFDHWLVGGEKHGEDSVISLTLENNTVVEAVFTSSQSTAQQLVHFWYFGDNNVENDVPLTQLDATYSSNNTKALLYFQPAISPYPPASGTAGIMDRVNDPTPVNYRDKGNENRAYSADRMRGIRTRNPLSIDGKEGQLVFDVPTVGYEKISMSLALSKTGNGPDKLVVQYSVNGDEWSDESLELNEIALEETFNMITLDFSHIENADDNEDFKVRFMFDGPSVTGNSGNARFNNISIDGHPIAGGMFDIDQENDAQYLERMFPIPTENNLTLQFRDGAQSNIRQIDIINTNGAVLKTFDKALTYQVQIHTGDLPAGVYIVRVVSTAGMEIKKFIKL